MRLRLRGREILLLSTSSPSRLQSVFSNIDVLILLPLLGWMSLSTLLGSSITLRLQLITLGLLTGTLFVRALCSPAWGYLWWMLALTLLPALPLYRYWSAIPNFSTDTSFLVPGLLPFFAAETQPVVAAGVLNAYILLFVGFWLALKIPLIRKTSGRLVLTSANTPLSVLAVFSSLSLVLAWFAAPPAFLWESRYASQPLRVHAVGLTSAWLISISIACYVAVVAYTSTGKKRKYAAAIAIVNLCLVVIYFGLLRGDREYAVFAGVLVVILMSTKVTNAGRSVTKRRLALVTVISVAIFTALQTVGRIRSSLFTAQSIPDATALVINQIGQVAAAPTLLAYGSWSAVIRSLFSAVESVEVGGRNLSWGQSYLDLGLSIPPGFLFEYLGLSRPIDFDSGPAVEFFTGTGGLHFLTVPFINFGLLGCFAFGFLTLYLWRWIATTRASRNDPVALLTLVLLAGVMPTWLWYGDKALVNALIILLLLICSLRLQVRLQSRRQGGRGSATASQT